MPELDTLNDTPIQLMRSPNRILNHIDLLRRKIEIGNKYCLIPSTSHPPDLVEANLQAVDDLVFGKASYRRIAARILNNLSDYGLVRSSREMDEDLWAALKVGLLEYHITDRCDLGCSHCFYGSSDDGRGATIPLTEIQHVRLLEPKAIVVTGGGEPTIYSDRGGTFTQAISEIRRAVPGAQLGLQTNGTVLPKGASMADFLYLRSSVDASNPQTYAAIKGRDFFGRVVENVVHFAKSGIPYAGVGFLFERQNVSEIPGFVEFFFDLIARAAPGSLCRFTIQFRPLGPGLPVLARVRAGADVYDAGATCGQLEALRAEVGELRRRRPELGVFIDRNTNLDGVWAGNSGHPLVPFRRCFVSLAYRMIRASGDNFPCFILVQHKRFSLGNSFGWDPAGSPDAFLGIALRGYYFHNCRSEFCNPAHCRQSLVNHTVEAFLSGAGHLPSGEMAEVYFF